MAYFASCYCLQAYHIKNTQKKRNIKEKKTHCKVFVTEGRLGEPPPITSQTTAHSPHLEKSFSSPNLRLLLPPVINSFHVKTKQELPI